MARTPRRPQPSALDGFRRLERTRSVVLDQQAVRAAVATLEPTRERPRRRRGTQRLAGAARLVAFAAALVIIVGTSVSLANSGRTSSTTERVPSAKPAQPVVVAAVDPVEDAPTERAPAAEPVARADAAPAPDPEPDPDPIVAAGPTLAATDTSPSRTLPFSGPEDTVQLALLGGSLLVVLGMLVQVAGQPLPARARG